MPHASISNALRANAKRLRTDMTDAERKLWGKLRAHRLLGLGFRRQMPVAGYVADFACPALKLIVEVDGSQHSTRRKIAADDARTATLAVAGWSVLRFWNRDVLRDVASVCDHIAAVALGKGCTPDA
jgi:very-short-patch-repair endonuclease